MRAPTHTYTVCTLCVQYDSVKSPRDFCIATNLICVINKQLITKECVVICLGLSLTFWRRRLRDEK